MLTQERDYTTSLGRDGGRIDNIERHRVQSRLLRFPELTTLATFQPVFDPCGHFCVLSCTLGWMRRRLAIRLGIGGGFHEGRQPWMPEKRRVGGPILRILVQTSADKRMCLS